MPTLRAIPQRGITSEQLPPRSEVRARKLTLYCRACRSHYSADRADYFTTPSVIIKCCNRPVVLARRVELIEEVQPDA